jgi:hypothetical protein
MAGGPQRWSTMAMRLLTPWKNPRSEKLWFRRRVPSDLVAFMGRREIKFSLGTTDTKLARIRCQEENVKLERMWHEHVHGKAYAMLSQRQIVALAGEFYREMVTAHRDNPGAPADWEAVINLDAKRKKRLTTLQPRVIHYRFTFEKEMNEFLKGRDLALSGETFDAFVSAYLEAKEQAAKHLMQNAGSPTPSYCAPAAGLPRCSGARTSFWSALLYSRRVPCYAASRGICSPCWCSASSRVWRAAA